MKKIKRIFIVFFFICFSQVQAGMPDYDLYVGLGVNFFKPKDNSTSQGRFSSNFSYSNKLGFNGGALAYIKMGNKLSLRTGLLASLRKFALQLPNQNIPEQNDYSLSYVDLPLTLSYSMADQVYVYGGGILGYRFSFSSNQLTRNSNFDFDQANFKTYLLGLTLGVHFNFMEAIGVDAYAEMGLGSLLKQNGDQATNPIGFGLRALYKF